MHSTGQTGTHSPQSVQRSGSMTKMSSPSEMHFSGQTSAQRAHETHSSSMKWAMSSVSARRGDVQKTAPGAAFAPEGPDALGRAGAGFQRARRNGSDAARQAAESTPIARTW